MEDRVRRLTDAGSVAVVGASERAGSVGATTLHQLMAGGYPGRILPVNPRYEQVAGLPCVPSLDRLDEPADLAVLAVPDPALEAQLALAGRLGVAGAVVFGGFSAVAAGDGRSSLATRLGAIASANGIALCGPNGMGFIDFRTRLRICGYSEPLDRVAGPVTLLSHSGSVFSALLHNDRGVEFDLAVSTGQEVSLTVADYLRHALDREETRVVALFLETLRDGPAMTEALALARQRDVPVVALTVGRSRAAGQLVRAHSGALAADHGAYEALFDAHAVTWVETLDELVDTLELFSSGRRAGAGGIATVHDSGGERAHLADLAEQEDVPFAVLSDATTARLRERLGTGLAVTNPLDAWGSGRDFEGEFRDLLLTMHDDPDAAIVALAVDLTTEDAPGTGYVRVAHEVQASTTKPFVLLTNLSSGIDRRDAAAVRSAGVPILEGSRSGLRAVRHLLDRRDALARPPAQLPDATTADVVPWRRRLSTGRPLDEAEALELLDAYGIPVVAHRRVVTRRAAVAAAIELGWPVVLKTAAPGVLHKSDVGGVALDLRDATEVEAAYRDVTARLGPEVVVARMAPRSGAELAFGMLADPELGSIVLVAAGGTLVELLHDRRTALPPVDRLHARRLLDGLAIRPILDGRRRAPAVDLAAVVDAFARFSALAGDLGDLISEIDVNPVVAGPDGCWAVDAAVVPRTDLDVTPGAATHRA